MTINEAIDRLTDLREVAGGDVPFCIERESTPSGAVNVFGPAALELYDVVYVECGQKSHWACLVNGNTTQVVVAY